MKLFYPFYRSILVDVTGIVAQDILIKPQNPVGKRERVIPPHHSEAYQNPIEKRSCSPS